MSGPTESPANPPNPKDYWSNRSAAWVDGASTGKGTDETFDRALIDAAGIAPGHRVLDLASGTGDPTMAIAGHVTGTGSVVSLDLTANMLAVGRKRADNLEFKNISFVVGNMERLPFPDGAFDAITCRNGLMFPEDKPACVRETCRVLRPGARAAWLVWSTIDDNPTYLIVNEGLTAWFGETFPHRMVRHVLGKEGDLAALLGEAGFAEIEERRFAYDRMVAPGDDYFRRAVARTVPHKLADMTEDDWTGVIAAIEEAGAGLRDGDAFRIPVVARIGVGIKSK